MTRRIEAGSDFLLLDPATAPAGGLTTWLVNAVRDAVADGRLAPGARLPASRVLAGELGLSRGVVVEAYRRLGDEGLVRGRPGAGTTVVDPAREAGGEVAGRTAPRRPPILAGQPPGQASTGTVEGHGAPGSLLARPGAGGRRTGASPLLPRLASQASAPIELDLSPGVPDLASFPRTLWLRAERAVLDRVTATELGYGDPRGSPVLRAELASWLARTRGLRARVEDVLVVAGVAQALALLAQTLHSRGATEIAVEDPGSRGARDELAHWGLTPRPVRVDEDGIDVAELAAGACSVALVTPAHQFPTGVVLAPHRRRELSGWAMAGGLVIEDDYDAEHRYDRAPVPSLQGALPDHVAHAGSTSKSLAPGMRLGWLVAPGWLQADLVAAKHASDLGSPALPQLTLAELLAGGGYDRHLRLVRRRLRSRRDAVLAAVHEQLPGARVEGVAAGLHLLVTLPDLAGQVEDTALASRLERSGVLVHPLTWHRHGPGAPGLVLGYAAHPADRLREAVRRVGEVVRAAAAASRGAAARRDQATIATRGTAAPARGTTAPTHGTAVPTHGTAAPTHGPHRR